jgi:hypothetical protein
MMAHVIDLFNESKVGALQNHKNMMLYCRFSADEPPPEFLTSDISLANDAFVIKTTQNLI